MLELAKLGVPALKPSFKSDVKTCFNNCSLVMPKHLGQDVVKPRSLVTLPLRDGFCYISLSGLRVGDRVGWVKP